MKADPIAGPGLNPSDCVVPVVGSIAAAVALVAFFLKARVKVPAVQEEADIDLAVQTSSDPLHHQRVLAKARQANHISSAVSYSRAGEVIKAMLELNKALMANAICRTPVVINHTPEEMTNLYRLHILNTEQPPNYAMLLQMQEMLGLDPKTAEAIEKEVLQGAGAFTI